MKNLLKKKSETPLHKKKNDYLFSEKSQYMQFQNFSYQEYRLKLHYSTILCPDLLLKENYISILQLPSLKKIVLNTTSAYYVSEKRNLIPAFLALELVTGQKVQLTYARKSLASFKIRESQGIGGKVTLRNNSMYTFLNLLTTILLPRLRDFRGISSQSFDNSGNFSMGFTELLLFPQLENHFELFQNFKGFNINFMANSLKPNQNFLLYSGFQIPLISNQTTKRDLI